MGPRTLKLDPWIATPRRTYARLFLLGFLFFACTNYIVGWVGVESGAFRRTMGPTQKTPVRTILRVADCVDSLKRGRPTGAGSPPWIPAVIWIAALAHYSALYRVSGRLGSHLYGPIGFGILFVHLIRSPRPSLPDPRVELLIVLILILHMAIGGWRIRRRLDRRRAELEKANPQEPRCPVEAILAAPDRRA